MYTYTILEIVLYNMILIYIIILYIYILDFFGGVLRTNSKHTNRSWCFEKGPFTAQTWRQVCRKWTLRGSHLRRRKRRQRGRESNGTRWKRKNRESGQQEKVRSNFWQVFWIKISAILLSSEKIGHVRGLLLWGAAGDPCGCGHQLASGYD